MRKSGLAYQDDAGPAALEQTRLVNSVHDAVGCTRPLNGDATRSLCFGFRVAVSRPGIRHNFHFPAALIDRHK